MDYEVFKKIVKNGTFPLDWDCEEKYYMGEDCAWQSQKKKSLDLLSLVGLTI
jgi:hypothetical protein